MGADAASGRKASRAPLLDGARGLAVLAMAVYHLAWDLSYFDLIDAEVPGESGWKLFAQSIAASFLLIVGISLALATRRGFDSAAFLRRLVLVGGAALVVTVATYFIFPDRYIFFGILHNIAVSSVIALAFLRLPAVVTIAIGAAMLMLPRVFASAIFDAAPLVWLGLGTVPPESNDFVPVFPWTGFVLIGLGAGRLAMDWLTGFSGGSDGWLARIGRWSLPIYLLHQPVLFGLTMLAAQMLGNGSEAARDTQRFARSCAVQCQAAGAQPSICAAACACTAERLSASPVWRAILGDSLTAEQKALADAVGAACYSEANTPRGTSPRS